MSIYGLLIVAVMTVMAIALVIATLANAFNKFENRCRHTNKFYDGDKHAIVCEDCGHIIVSFSAKESQDLLLRDLYVWEIVAVVYIAIATLVQSKPSAIIK